MNHSDDRLRRLGAWKLVPCCASSLSDAEILGPAVAASFQKLDPGWQVRNPVMLTCEVGALVTLVYAVRRPFAANGQLDLHLAISSWPWFTVVFANFAEAVAEGARQGASGVSA